MSHCSYGVEFFARVDEDDRGYYVNKDVRYILGSKNTKNTFHVDSCGLFDTISTLHDGKEISLRQTFQRLRDSFEYIDIDVCDGYVPVKKFANSLTMASNNSTAYNGNSRK